MAGEKGSADSARDPRGFAVKLCTEDGNYDIVGNNTPIFFIRDGIKSPDFIRTQKRDPQTNLKNPTAMWDFWSLSPESLYQFTILFSDRGTPRSYRHMNGYSSHAFSWINSDGERSWIKYHFKTRQGIENFNREEAVEVGGRNPDHATRDLYDAIERGDYPSWQVCVQVMTEPEALACHLTPSTSRRGGHKPTFRSSNSVSWLSTGNLRTISRKSNRPLSSRQTLSRGSVSHLTRCSRPGCSPIPMRTVTVLAPTTLLCRLTVLTPLRRRPITVTVR